MTHWITLLSKHTDTHTHSHHSHLCVHAMIQRHLMISVQTHIDGDKVGGKASKKEIEKKKKSTKNRRDIILFISLEGKQQSENWKSKKMTTKIVYRHFFDGCAESKYVRVCVCVWVGAIFAVVVAAGWWWIDV